MSEIPFHQTRMGVKFFEADMPRLIDTLEKLTEAVEKLVDANEDEDEPKQEEDRDHRCQRWQRDVAESLAESCPIHLRSLVDLARL